MKKLLFSIHGVVLFILLFGTAVQASDPQLPIKDGKKIVAEINGEPITWEELQDELTPIPEGADKQDQATRTLQREQGVLRKLINIRLILQEAERMNLDDLAEIQNMVEVNSRITLREQLLENQTKDIRADDADVEKHYKQMVREWKIKSILFEKEESAKKFQTELKKNGNFEEWAQKAPTGGIVKGFEETDFVKEKDLLPEIKAQVQKVKVKEISPVIKIQQGYVVFQVTDVRYPDNPQTREWAKQEALKEKQTEAMKQYIEGLLKSNTKVNKAVLKRINYEAKQPGFDKLLKSTEVVAEIKGDKPVTVGDLTEYIKQTLYHGVEKAIESKRLNKKKAIALDEMLRKRALQNEAIRLGIDKSESYRKAMKRYEDSVIFGAFFQKVIVPEIKLNDDDLKAYYKEHKKDYMYPEMMKIDSIVFARDSDAEKAKLSIEKGTEFEWLKKNADGQVDKNAKGLLAFGDMPLTVNDLPEGIRKALSGAKEGDTRLYKSPEGFTYLLIAAKVISPKEQPFEEIKENVRTALFNEQVPKKIEEYADKLRSASEIKIYLPEQA